MVERRHAARPVGRGLCAAAMAAASLLPAWADEEPVPEPRWEPRAEVDLSSRPPSLAAPPSWAPQPPGEVRARWWLGHGGFGVGAGADLPGWRDGSMRPVLGLRADLGPSARLVYEVGPTAAGVMAGEPSTGPARFALEFRPSPHPASSLRDGLLRVQVSATSTLQLRPRSGGLFVAWRSKF